MKALVTFSNKLGYVPTMFQAVQEVNENQAKEKLTGLKGKRIDILGLAFLRAKSIFGNKIEYASSAIACLKDADCCIIVTEWDEFKKLKPEDFTQNMRQPILIDGRRIYKPEEFSQKLKFVAIGLGQ